MRKWFLAWYREVAVNETYERVFDRFDFAEEVSRGEVSGEYRDRRDGLIFDWRYRWEVEPGSGSIRVSERAWVSLSWFLTICLSLSLSLLSYALAVRTKSILNPLLMLICVVCFIVFALSSAEMFEYPSPVSDFVGEKPPEDKTHPYFSILVAVFPFTAAGYLLNGFSQLLAVLAVIVVFAAYYGFQEEVEDSWLDWQRAYAERMRQLPQIASDYVLLLLTLAPVPLLFVVVHDSKAFVSLLEVAPSITLGVYAIFAAGLVWTTQSGAGERYSVGRARFTESGGNALSRRVAIVTGGVVLVVGLGYGYLCYLVFRGAPQFLASVPFRPGVGVLLATSVPVLYVVTGFLTQIWDVCSGFYLLAAGMERGDVVEGFEPEAETYVLNYSGHFAGAASFLTRDFIVVSEGLCDDLSQGELDAVVAHEEKHVVEGEAKLAMLVALLSPFVVVGKNVVYALLDFRTREYRADEYAAGRTSEEQIVGALESLQEVKAEGVEGERSKLEFVTPTLAPSLGGEEYEASSLAERYLDLYFGNFAVAEVHPSLDDRIRAFRSE